MSAAEAPLAQLLAIMARLRDPQGGCPWDRAQTFASIAPYTLEEAYEVADAIAGGDPDQLRDELGDLLFQVVFHARLAEERGWFDFAAVAAAISEKLVRRHPHVFAGAPTGSARRQNEQWEEIKARERAERSRRRAPTHSQVLADVPLALPALTRAAKLGGRAARVGFDWPDAAGVRAKVIEELHELDAALEQATADADGADGAGASPAAVAAEPSHADAVTEELGDLLFALANWSRHLRIDPEAALRAAGAKFERRFVRMEQHARARGVDLRDLSAEQWDALWEQAKRERPSGQD